VGQLAEGLSFRESLLIFAALFDSNFKKSGGEIGNP
jgi:hypothetical protein